MKGSGKLKAESGKPGTGYALGVDGGGSKTDAVILDASGAVVGTGLGGASNANFVSRRTAASAFRRAIRAAIKEAGTDPAQITQAGCTFGTVAAEVLAELGIPARPVWFGESAVAFERAGIDDLRGVALIAGTGSSCFAADGQEVRVGMGGWGPILGDEGSAYHIGITGIRRALLAAEGRGPETTLEQSIREYFDVPSTQWVIGKLCDKKAIQSLVAGFAPEVSKAAYAGDAVAAEVIDHAGTALGELAAFVAGRVFAREDQFPFVLAGGVFNIGRLVIDPIRRILGSRFPNARIVIADMRPGEAVARLAMHHPERERPRHRRNGIQSRKGER